MAPCLGMASFPASGQLSPCPQGRVGWGPHLLCLLVGWQHLRWDAMGVTGLSWERAPPVAVGPAGR